MAKIKYIAGALAASIILPQLTDPYADELFGICEVNDDTSLGVLKTPDTKQPRYNGPNMDDKTIEEHKSPNSTKPQGDPLEIQDIFANVTQDQRYIGLLDTNHSIGDIRVDVYSDEFIAHYQAMDVRTFFIERDRTGQDVLTQFLEDEITSDELYNWYGLNSGWVGSEEEAKAQHIYIAGQMKKMHDAGITIQGIDYVSEMPEISLSVTFLFINDLTATVQQACGNSEVTDRASAYHALSRTWMTLAVLPFLSNVIEHRQNEIELGHIIKTETETNGGRSAIFYGAKHFENISTSFVSAIGKEQFFNLALTGQNGYTNDDTKIDAVYDTKNDIGIFTDKVAPSVETIGVPEI